MEIKNYKTPFTITTRSATESLYDLSPNKSTIDVSNLSFNNGSPYFDGIDQNIVQNAPHTIDITNVSYEVIVKGVRTSDYGYIIHNGTSTSTGNSYLTIGIDALNRLYGAFSGQYSTMYSDVYQSTTVFHHLVLTWDGSTQKFYVDNILKASQPLTTMAYDMSSVMGIGAGAATNNRPIDGEIPVVKIYNKTLDETEISKNYNNYKYRFNLS